MNDPREKDEQLSEALHAAYPSHQPDERLHGRMVEAERSHRLQSFSRKSGFRKGWLTLVGGLALLSVVGFTAYKYFFDRPGEAAIALIPADADLVVTLDTNPSSRQVATFLKIGEALKREGILEKLDDSLTDILNQNPVAKRIRPFVSKNMALAVWMPAGGFESGPEPAGAFFVALTNAGEVDSILSDSIPSDTNQGFRVYNVDKKVYGAVIGNYLVVAPTPAVLGRINTVHSGSGESVAQLPEYQKARASLADDANLMVFVSPEAMSVMDKGGPMGMNPMAGAKWMAMGMALRDAGLEFTYQMPMNQSNMPSLKHLAAIEPMDTNVLRKLPEGAYGVIGYSQVGKYWDFFKDTASQDRSVKGEMDKGLADFEKETGLNIDKDIVPAFGGNLLLAVYPSPTMNAESVDGVFLVDDAHGANPAELADRVRVLIEKQSAKKGDGVKFVSTKQGNATIWRLDPSSKAEFVKGLNKGPDMGGFDEMPDEDWDTEEVGHEPHSAPVLTPEDKKMLEKLQAESNKPSPAMADKTIIYAQIGNSLLIASSEAMMTKALQAYEGRGSSLADDIAFSGLQGRISDRSQSLMVVSMHRIMQALRPHIEQGMAGNGINADDIVNLFGPANSALTAGGWYDGQVVVGEMFLPLDYERLVRIVGVGVRQGEKDKSQESFSIRDAPRLAPRVVKAGRLLATL